MSEARIGCSGFNYRDWRGKFYPEGLPQKGWLRYYSAVFSTVELNVTFYRLPRPQTVDRWRDETPPRFVFSLKGSRFITHTKRLLNPEEALDLFFEVALRLGEKLKAVLWQLPPSFRRDTARLLKFVRLVSEYPVRSTIEFRNETWITEEVLDICRGHNICLCMADWPEFIDVLPETSDFVYIRRHGKGGGYATRYSKAELTGDARRIEGYLKTGKDVFVYFNNDAYAYAASNAMELNEILK